MTITEQYLKNSHHMPLSELETVTKKLITEVDTITDQNLLDQIEGQVNVDINNLELFNDNGEYDDVIANLKLIDEKL